MPVSIIAILVAVPIITAFFLFVLLPRMRRDEDANRSRKGQHDCGCHEARVVEGMRPGCECGSALSIHGNSPLSLDLVLLKAPAIWCTGSSGWKE